MTRQLLLVGCVAALSACGGQGDASGGEPPETTPATDVSQADVTEEPGVVLARLEQETVEVGCGKCIYHMPGVDGCTGAVVIDGKHLLVTGIGLDAHNHGLCSDAAEAVVTGDVMEDQFVASQVDLQ